MLRLFTWLLGLATAVVGVLHLVWPEPFLRIMPPALPAPLTLVYVSGVFEILGGLGVLHPVTRRAAAGGLLVLYVMVFPANIYMALYGIDPVTQLPGTPFGRYVRLPFQLGLFAWCVALMRGPGPVGERAARSWRGRELAVALVGAILPWFVVTDAAPWLSTVGMSAGIAAAVLALWCALDVGVTESGEGVEVRRGPLRERWSASDARWEEGGVRLHTPSGAVHVVGAADGPPVSGTRLR